MPSLSEAYWRHANLYLSVAEQAEKLFLSKSGQEKGLLYFDQNHEQIDKVLSWAILESSDAQTDLLFAKLVDMISPIGMIRWSIKDKLIPISEHQVAAAKRLGWKELEANSLDGLGILYAYLGYLSQATYYFQLGLDMAKQSGDKELIQDIESHFKKAVKQRHQKNTRKVVKPLFLLWIIPAWVNLYFAKIWKDSFAEIKALLKIANLYLNLEKWISASLYFQQAISISQKLSYRFGQLQASMGLLQAEFSKSGGISDSPSLLAIKELSNEFEWSTDVDVLETLLEIAPAIGRIEAIADQKAKKDSASADEMYQQLDEIMQRTEEIVSAAIGTTDTRHEIFLTNLKGIKANLTRLIELSTISGSLDANHSVKP